MATEFSFLPQRDPLTTLITITNAYSACTCVQFCIVPSCQNKQNVQGSVRCLAFLNRLIVDIEASDLHKRIPVLCFNQSKPNEWIIWRGVRMYIHVKTGTVTITQQKGTCINIHHHFTK